MIITRPQDTGEKTLSIPIADRYVYSYLPISPLIWVVLDLRSHYSFGMSICSRTSWSVSCAHLVLRYKTHTHTHIDWWMPHPGMHIMLRVCVVVHWRHKWVSVVSTPDYCITQQQHLHNQYVRLYDCVCNELWWVDKVVIREVLWRCISARRLFWRQIRSFHGFEISSNLRVRSYMFK